MGLNKKVTLIRSLICYQQPRRLFETLSLKLNSLLCENHLTAYNNATLIHKWEFHEKVVKRGLRYQSIAKPTGEKLEKAKLEELIRRSTDKVKRDTESPAPSTENLSFTIGNVETAPSELNKNKSKTGMDIAVNIRRQKRSYTEFPLSPTKYDLKQSAIDKLKYVDVCAMTDERLAKLIRRNVIYADKNLVVFNKPYGLPMHGGDGTKQSVKNVLPMVSKMIFGINTSVPLLLCHRLNKNTTGITICATNDEIASNIMKSFRMRRVLRKYLAVVVGEPEPHNGVIDMPMCETTLSATKSARSHSRMIIKPDMSYDVLTGKESVLKTSRSDGHIAITYYRTIDTSGTLSLVELQPQTSVKHQLRVHMSDGLSCPMLGDHKYSRYGSLAPQVLPPKVLKLFNIPHSKTRYMPLHLHLQQVLIPDVLSDSPRPNMVVGARLPFHFSRTLRILKMKPGVHEGWKGDHRPVKKTTAEPLRKDDVLYTDPTLSVPTETPRSHSSDDCEKVFRTRIKVKYQKA
uniref:Pseudouridylate synthase RPUSD4, mitochondrial n=1 Tax=Ciona savignyi TaxID=51511 RepID=H2Y874_CIOSA